jgi:hypothetical protein
MPLELLLQCGLLLVAPVAAFAISSLVGMLVGCLWAAPHPLGGARDEPGPPPSGRDSAHEARAGRPPGDSLAPAGDLIT